MNEILVFLGGMCASALLISLTSAVVVWLLARHAPVLNCEEGDDG